MWVFDYDLVKEWARDLESSIMGYGDVSNTILAQVKPMPSQTWENQAAEDVQINLAYPAKQLRDSPSLVCKADNVLVGRLGDPSVLPYVYGRPAPVECSLVTVRLLGKSFA